MTREYTERGEAHQPPQCGVVEDSYEAIADYWSGVRNRFITRGGHPNAATVCPEVPHRPDAGRG